MKEGWTRWPRRVNLPALDREGRRAKCSFELSPLSRALEGTAECEHQPSKELGIYAVVGQMLRRFSDDRRAGEHDQAITFAKSDHIDESLKPERIVLKAFT